MNHNVRLSDGHKPGPEATRKPAFALVADTSRYVSADSAGNVFLFVFVREKNR